MRHGKKVNHLSRKKGHRRALLANMAISLIQHKRITTTLAKAKALRKYVEPLVTKAKNGKPHDYRVVFSYLQNKEAIKELFDVVRPKVGDRAGGYTRIIKLVNRRSDNAEMAIIEFVDFNETMVSASKANSEGEAKKKRTRRSKKKSDATETAAAEEVVNEEPTPEVTDQAVAEATEESATETDGTEEDTQA